MKKKNIKIRSFLSEVIGNVENTIESAGKAVAIRVLYVSLKSRNNHIAK